MRIGIAGLAALLAVALAGGALAETIDDEIQEQEQPGSAIEMEIGGGQVEIGRERNMAPSPVEVEGEELNLPVGPTNPAEIDPIDDELPGEGPEDLSGPGDEDPLPY